MKRTKVKQNGHFYNKNTHWVGTEKKTVFLFPNFRLIFFVVFFDDRQFMPFNFIFYNNFIILKTSINFRSAS